LTIEWKNRRIKIEEFGIELSCHVIAAAAVAVAVALLLVVMAVTIKCYTLYS